MNKPAIYLAIFGIVLLGVAVCFSPGLREKREANQLKIMVQNGNAAGVSDFIKRNPRLLKVDLGGRHGDNLKALSIAAGLGNVNICSNLIKLGADVNEIDRYHYTPLHCAAMADQPGVAIFLIQQGADLTLKDFQGMTPLDLARKFHVSSNLIGILATGTSNR